MLKRSVIFLLSFCLWCSLPVCGQPPVGIVDMEATVNKWAEASGVNSLLDGQKAYSQTLLQKTVRLLQTRYSSFQRILERTDPSPAQFELLEKQLIEVQNNIAAFERLMTDTIPTFRAQLNAFIQFQIENRLKELRSSRLYYPLVLQEHIIYKETDYPTELIELSATAVELKVIRQEAEIMAKKLGDKILHYEKLILESP